MQSVNSFIKLLGKNYYSDFITDINAETLDFDNYYVLVKYQNSFFYELSNNEINKKRKEIFTKIKESYQEALTEIYAIILSHDSSKMNTYLDLNASAVRSHLITIKKDFYIDDEQSRYFSIIEDNPVVSDLESMYRKNVKNSEIALNENVYNLINTSKHQNAESLYYLEYLYERNILLSLIPFSLFAIGKLFIVQLEKIKSKINPEILVNQNNTNAKLKTQKKYPKVETYFESFLKLLDNNLILKKSTATGVMVDFKGFIKEIKSEILEQLQTKGENRNDYLDYLINEIEKQDYLKDINISHIQKWLEEYKISIEEIFEMNYYDNPIEAIINRHYMDMDKYSEEKDKAHLLQSDFRDYFCKYYADELITFIKSKKSNKAVVSEQKSASNQYPENQYLKSFIDEINNEKDLYSSTFTQCYEYGILHFTEYLKVEINENVLNLPEEKIKPYLDLVINKITGSHFYHTEENSLDKWINRFELQGLEFPFLKNKKVNDLVTKSINYYLWDEKHRALMEELQLDFFYYAAMTEAKKIIVFIEGLTTNTQSELNIVKQKVEIDAVFKSPEAFEIFNFLIEKFDITNENIKKRGVQAQLNAIWGCPKSKKEIFKEHAELKQYVSFLNEEYKSSFNSRTMSDGSKYHNSIKDWLN
jgi:hypothetical protein